jgi:hypothetical protein
MIMLILIMLILIVFILFLRAIGQCQLHGVGLLNSAKNTRAGSLLRARPQEKQLYDCAYLPETMDTKYSESSARFAVERRACSFAASMRSVQIS